MKKSHDDISVTVSVRRLERERKTSIIPIASPAQSGKRGPASSRVRRPLIPSELEEEEIFISLPPPPLSFPSVRILPGGGGGEGREEFVMGATKARGGEGLTTDGGDGGLD